ncbi:MAG: hypothetical protein JRI59_06780 [Deltaproteobacteria bacterium]|nr:hypothetical protein [Deltaproteobacteria bacterium]
MTEHGPKRPWWLESNTVRLGAATILGAVIAWLTGQETGLGAVVLALTGILQILQRLQSPRTAPPAEEQ